MVEVKSISKVITAPKDKAMSEAYPNPNEPALGNKTNTIAPIGPAINRYGIRRPNLVQVLSE